MNWIIAGLKRPKLMLSVAFLLSFSGVVSWLTMPRMEDPTIPERNAIVVTVYPGADPEKVERLVADPIEEFLAEVEEVITIESTIRAEVVITNVELRGNLESDAEINEVWDEIRRKLQEAKKEFPEGANEPELDTDILETEAVLVAVTGAADPLVLMDGAERLKKALLRLDVVANVKIAADPGDQITIEFDDALSRRLGVDPGLLANQLSARNANIPGGNIRSQSRTTFLRPFAEFETVEEIERTPILLPSGAAIPLGELARVRRGPMEPVSEIMHFQGARAVGLGVVPVDNINLVAFGEEVRGVLERMKSKLAPLEITEVTYQPERVRDRLTGLGNALLLGIAIVTLVLVSAMGFRLGLIVAGIVPLIAFASVGIFNFGGGILHQLSIAALVIALGLLVDNAIVVSEAIQWHLDRGRHGMEAARLAIRELALPLLAATGTTLAAFVPMLLAEGNVGSFTRDIPRVIMLTLAISYFFAMFVTPFMAARFQRPRREKGNQKESWLDKLSTLLSGLSTTRPRLVLASISVLVIGAVLAASGVSRQFFPYGDRNQLLVTLELPEGSHIEATNEATRQLERLLREREDIFSVASFVGSGTPHFYYNLPKNPNSPHLAQLLVTTSNKEMLPELDRWVRARMAKLTPDARTVTRIMEQGPPIDAPIEVRIFAGDLDVLQARTREVVAIAREVRGANTVRHDLGQGQPTIKFQVDDAAAGRHQLSRANMAIALARQTRGIPAGQFRKAEDPVPIVVRAAAGEDTSVARLASIDVTAPGGRPVPLEQIARFESEWVPAIINHYNRGRVATVSANLDYGTPFNQVMNDLKVGLNAMSWDDELSYELGGAEEASVESNMAIVSKLPYTLFILAFILLAEFNSLRKVNIIMITIPLAATGVIPGLLLTNQPFGFMSLLGVLALAGIVVNNAIVLLEVIDTRRQQGSSVISSVRAAVSQRTRPILLTTATTVAGLLPLAFSSSSLWPPMASAMISGLLSSTLLTLLAVPALYTLSFPEKRSEVKP